MTGLGTAPPQPLPRSRQRRETRCGPGDGAEQELTHVKQTSMSAAIHGGISSSTMIGGRAVYWRPLALRPRLATSLPLTNMHTLRHLERNVEAARSTRRTFEAVSTPVLRLRELRTRADDLTSTRQDTDLREQTREIQRFAFVAVLDLWSAASRLPAHLQVFRGVASRLRRGSRCSRAERRLFGFVLVVRPPD